MKVYKLFRGDMTTQMSNHVWSIGPRLDLYYGGEGGCASGVIHYYESPEMAALISPIHIGPEYNRLFECEVEHPLNSDGVKHWSKDIRLTREIEAARYTTEQRVKFAILCALEVNTETAFVTWARNWLSGKDRSYRATDATARAATDATARATDAAARATDATARAATDATAWAAAWATARAAAWAAADATGATDKAINFSKIIAKL